MLIQTPEREGQNFSLGMGGLAQHSESKLTRKEQRRPRGPRTLAARTMLRCLAFPPSRTFSVRRALTKSSKLFDDLCEFLRKLVRIIAVGVGCDYVQRRSSDPTLGQH